MVWLIGHRQPKGAATAMLRPTATAPHLDSTGNCRPWTSGIRTLNSGVRFPAVRSLSLLSLADPQWRGQRCDANAGSAAVAAGGSQTSNSRSRPHCSRSDARAGSPPAAAISGTADIAGDHDGGGERTPSNWSRKSSPAGSNDRSSSARQVAADPAGRGAPKQPDGEPSPFSFHFYEAAVRDLTHPAIRRQSVKATAAVRQVGGSPAQPWMYYHVVHR